jgi:hypothetical protein
LGAWKPRACIDKNAGMFKLFAIAFVKSLFEILTGATRLNIPLLTEFSTAHTKALITSFS